MLENLFKRINKKNIYAMLAIVGILEAPLVANAEDASVHFGSDSYTAVEGESFPVGVYINTANGTGSYAVAVKYDPAAMEYVGGADVVDAENGILYFTGDSGANEVKYMVTFNPRTAEGSTVSIVAADIKTADTGEAFNIVSQGAAPIGITPKEPEEEVVEEQTTEEEATPEEETVTEDTAVTEETKEPEPVIETVEPEVTNAEPETVEEEKEDSILYNSYFIIAIAFIAAIVFIQIVVSIIFKLMDAKDKKGKSKDVKNKKKRKNRKAIEKRITSLEDSENISVMDLESDSDSKFGTEPVIEVDDVTMEFHIASTQASGLKDYIIQFLKRQITYRKLFALYHVSFNVYPGEVVGIIGTNGSGKSTLLKIVSGALRPTEGEVRADRKKIQLLTLGTGFDMELTGRENVYLNGAIIGYSKQFIDEHYDEIVSFAELEDFMDEKVKNYSSGMVSRLGFAIATAGDAAEILILDEVLSVGDEFFRQKSLKRVKEMIHGGSTVLLVSHSMNTILDNCSKCVWIEKGKLMMVDTPKVVCEEYRKSKENNAG